MGASLAIGTFVNEHLARLALAMVLVVGTLVLLGMRIDVPTVLWTLDATAVTFYFAGVQAKPGG